MSDEHVEKPDCDRRHVSIRRITTIIMGMIGFFVFIAGLCIAMSTSTQNRTGALETKFHSHDAAQTSDWKHLYELLNRIEKGQDANRKLLDQILRDGRDH